jgi:acetyltransferase
MFAPKSIAMIGASERPGSVGEATFNNILTNGYQGIVYPINFKAKHIKSVKAYPSLTALGEPVDLVVMAVPIKAVMSAMDECATLGIKNVSIMTAGFKEVGGEGIVLENKLKTIAEENGINLIGPNCLGHINTDPEVGMNASFARRMPLRGNLGFISQSGALCGAVLDYAAANNIGFSKFISFGNKAGVSELDLLNYMAEDPQTDAILMYLEDLVEGKEFIDLAREVTMRKPILAIKTGRTAQGAAAAASHTGSLAGSDNVYDAIFKQAGIIRVDTVEGLFDYAMAFANQPIPKGNRVAILTNAGGPGIMTTDACINSGLQISKLSDDTVKSLKEKLPSMASTKNPVDVIGDALADRYKLALDELLVEPNIDGIIVVVTPQNMTEIKGTAEAIVVANESQKGNPNRKPILTAFMGDVDMSEGFNYLNNHGVPSYKYPESAARSFANMVTYRKWVERPQTGVKAFKVDKVKVQQILDGAIADGRSELPEIESLEVLKAYGFPVPQFFQAKTPAEAVTAAAKIGGKVVLKISSPDILHKTDAHGVELNLEGEAEVRAAAERILAAAKVYKADARVWGLTVEPMSKKSIREVILGVIKDSRFGSVIMFGIGGVFTELLKDVSFRLAPVREQGAKNMLESLKMKALFETFRGTEAADKDAIYDAIERISQLVIDFPQIKEMDINPMLIYPKGEGAVAVDARIILEKQK